MYSITIKAENASHLAALVKHLETFEVPAFIRTEVNKPKAVAPVAEESKATSVKIEKPKVAKVEKPKAPEKTGLTYDEVKAATFDVAGIPGKGPALIAEVLSEFSVGHAKELKEEQWAEYVEKCKEVAEANKEPASYA